MIFGPDLKGHVLGKALRTVGARQNAQGYCMLMGAICLVAAVGLGGAVLSRATEDSTAMFKRSAASAQACEAAGAELKTLQRESFLVDDCSLAIVTPVLGEEGRVILSRTLQWHVDDIDGEPTTYSLKMDGRGFDKWRVLDVKRAPSRLTVDVSLLPATRSAVSSTAQR